VKRAVRQAVRAVRVCRCVLVMVRVVAVADRREERRTAPCQHTIA
jgi:CTP synthase (UTP-ammonia lyase)